MTDRSALLASWARIDGARAVLPADREIIEASASLRELIVGVLLAGGDLDELYDACSMLGRLIAARGGSPSFASATLDGASEALGTRDAPWLVPARATVVALAPVVVTAPALSGSTRGPRASRRPRRCRA